MLLASSDTGGSPVGLLMGYILIGIVLWVWYRRHLRKARIEAAAIARRAAIREAAEVFDGTGPLLDDDDEEIF